jgi:hypothetical protein
MNVAVTVDADVDVAVTWPLFAVAVAETVVETMFPVPR